VTKGCSAAVSLKAHINGRARRELWRREFFGDKDLSHIKWLKKNSFISLSKAVIIQCGK